MASSLDIRNFTRRPAPGFPYQKTLDKALPDWEVSLVFAGERRAKHLNEVLRSKTYIPNVLSYEVGAKSGEVVICLKEAERQAKTYDMTYTQFVGFLFIHGLLHLNGMRHGTTMEHKERALLATVVSLPSKKSNGSTHQHRN